MVASSSAQVTTTYTYDPQGQVRTVKRPARMVTYGYDAAGNRIQLTVLSAPTSSDSTASTSYGTPVSVMMPAGGESVALYMVAWPVSGALNWNTLAWVGGGWTATYTPNSGFYGVDSFTYYVSNPAGASPTYRATITVSLPTAPSVSNTSLSSSYNGSGSVALPVSGVYSSIGFPSAPIHGALSLSGATVTYTPVSGYSGSDSFTYNATGPGGTSGTATVSVSVAAVAAPTLQTDTAEVHSQNTVDISPLANDSDPSGYPLTITSVTSNGGGTLTIINGGTQVRFVAPTVATRASKTVTLTYTASNGHGGTASSTISVFVETEYYD